MLFRSKKKKVKETFYEILVELFRGKINKEIKEYIQGGYSIEVDSYGSVWKFYDFNPSNISILDGKLDDADYSFIVFSGYTIAVEFTKTTFTIYRIICEDHLSDLSIQNKILKQLVERKKYEVGGDGFREAMKEFYSLD